MNRSVEKQHLKLVSELQRVPQRVFPPDRQPPPYSARHQRPHQHQRPNQHPSRFLNL
ncbi:hypothetical protein MMO38_01715 [Acinetobacter sp. NIPH 1852]|nr:hypothetical protein [Acinetobacter sp. NIPH 1852]MCH7306858.1 hypothetical protein [Acinetobacter sp. NIPH 1852]